MIYSIDPKNVPTAELHQYMLGAVAPRPIAFVSTISPDGIPNLAPYSFFNAYSSKPPIMVFSSNRRVRDNTTKDTLFNIEQMGECVINIVNYDMAYQMALASVEYPAEVNEFAKSGLTPLKSDKVKPFRVAESPVQIECKVTQIIPLGDQGGAGNLILCEIVLIHIKAQVLDDKGRIDPYKMEQMARMGGAYYCRVVPEAILEIKQPVEKIGMGFDALPATIRHSPILSGNDLAQLASETALPTPEQMAEVADDAHLKAILSAADQDSNNGNSLLDNRQASLHKYAKELIARNQVLKAWQVLMYG